jgi:hypothetical protein
MQMYDVVLCLVFSTVTPFIIKELNYAHVKVQFYLFIQRTKVPCIFFVNEEYFP